MRSFSASGDRFNETVRIVGGPTTRARVQRAEDGDRIGAEFALPKTTLRVGRKSIITSGQVVKLKGGELFLVADHSATGEYRTHHLFPTDRHISWQRPRTIINPVSKQKMSDGLDDLGMIWVMWERTRREFTDLSIRIAQESYLLATGADVQLEDVLDGKRVKRVTLALGVKIVELQG